MRDCLSGDIAARTCPVLDEKRLAELLRQPLTEQARGDVGSAASCKADDDAHRPRWIGLRPRVARQRRQCRSACQMQKFAAGKFHAVPAYSAHDPPRLGQAPSIVLLNPCAW
jgi:hypothetical protein